MSISCEPSDLVTEASNYCCVPKGMENEVIIYLLNQILGTGLTPQQLMDGAACMKCIPGLMQQDVILYLLDQIANGGGGGGCTYQDMQVAWEPTTLKLGENLGFFTYGDIPGITKIQFLGTTNIAGFDIESTTSITELDFPNLVSIDPLNTQGGYLQIRDNAGLVTARFTNLISLIAGFRCYNSPLLTTLELSQFVSCGGTFAIDGNTSLASIDLPQFVFTGAAGFAFDATGDSNLATVNVPSYVPPDGSSVVFNGCALNAASVELILRRCVLAGVTTCIIDISGGTNTGLAALNAQGQADYAALVVAGNTVTLNP